ncbi:MAG: cupin domain-containing protein [Thermoanaerobaculia bacterium]|nr:cupin domain-containing protein [Thermoanaerobaculia bacterium]
MNTVRAMALAFAVGAFIGVLVVSTVADEREVLKSESVLRSDLESASGLEVIVSVVEMPSETALPKHHHPGEEFIYVLEGSGSLWIEGSEQIELAAGDAAKIPLERIHTAVSEDEPLRAVVFRVHKKGEPERIMAE